MSTASSVPPSDGATRLVVDARPVNAVMAASPRVELPTPDLLSRLEVPEGATLFAAKADLDNYYHRIRIPGWMVPYFALPPVRAGDVGRGKDFGQDTMIYPCCTTLPMGWSHSAYLAQVAHEYQIASLSDLDPADRITKFADFRVDRPRYLVYIDDLILIGLECHLDRLTHLQQNYCDVMTRVGLPPKPSKVVPPSCEGVECIGVEVHGRHLTAGVHPAKLAKLARRTEALLQRGRCTGHDLSRLVGHWSWAFLARRAAFSVFNSVYRFIETAGRRVFQVWPTVARELKTAICLAPVLFASLSSPWFSRTIATDASGSGQGVVAAKMDAPSLEALARTRPPEKLADPEAPAPIDRTLPLGLEPAVWKQIVSAPFRRAEHINVLELRALTTGVRWAISFPRAIGSRILLWCDSLVVVGAVRKGRSSAHQLLRKLRTLTAYLLATGIQLYCNWIPTEVNPADGPSRRFEFDSTLGFPGEGPPGLDFLRGAVHAESTKQKYDAAVYEFYDWMVDRDIDPDTVEELDEALCQFFHELYLDRGGACRGLAEAALSGVNFRWPFVKGRLFYSQQALRGWRRLTPSVPHPPFTWDLTVCVGLRLALSGRWALGVGTLLAFECYLRVGELCGLRRKDVAVPGDRRLGSLHRGMYLRLKHTKTGNNQWVEIRSPTVRSLVELLLASVGSRGRSRLFPVSTSTFRKHFKASCEDLGLSPDYVPHSLRHGGATHDHLRGMPLEDILRHGRWASTKSARHYIQAGRALLLSAEIPEDVLDLAQALVPHVLWAFTLSQRH